MLSSNKSQSHPGQIRGADCPGKLIVFLMTNDEIGESQHGFLSAVLVFHITLVIFTWLL